MQISEAFPPEPRQGGPFQDFSGKLRGHCHRCNGCPGYDMPRCTHEPSLLGLCVHCGCDAHEHEAMRAEADKSAEREDDILKHHKWDQ